VRGELVDTLANLMDAMQTGRVKPVRRVVIETTGLADPAPVMQAIMGNPIIATPFGSTASSPSSMPSMACRRSTITKRRSSRSPSPTA
jgi:hypothetical protein